MADKLYNESSIESLSPLEFTRLRPGVYAGDTTYSTQLLVEIISNSIDEFRLGHGNQIDVVIDKDVVSVRDYGQGFIPNSYRDDGIGSFLHCRNENDSSWCSAFYFRFGIYY